MLLEMGERPSILSRGYARKIAGRRRRRSSAMAARVLDRRRAMRATSRRCWRAPFLRAAVLVSSSRYAAGRIAESRLGCTVHVLDDGFQHFDLMRDVDLLVAPDASDTRTLPFGRFASRSMRPRPPMRCWWRPTDPDGVGADLQGPPYCRSNRLSASRAASAGPPPDRPAFAFAGIAKPERFFARSREGRLDADRAAGRSAITIIIQIAEIEEVTPRGEIIRSRGDPDDRKGLVRVCASTRSDRLSRVPLEVTIEPAFAAVARRASARRRARRVRHEAPARVRRRDIGRAAGAAAAAVAGAPSSAKCSV